MSGFKENITGFAVRIQPNPGQYNEPTIADLMAISAPDDGYDDVTSDDSTQTGSVFAAPRQFIGRRGRAGATMVLRAPGGVAPPAAGDFVPGRVLQGMGFAEIINTAVIQGVATGGSANQIKMAVGSSVVDDFYKGMPIQHANIGAAGTVKGTSLIRGYDGSLQMATLMETMSAAVGGGQYTIPISLTYALTRGLSIPLLSAKVWRHKKSRRYRDCAITSFAINIPVANLQSTDAPTIEFAMAGVPMPSVDEMAPAIPDALLTTPPLAKNGKFAFNGIKIGHQTLRFEFTLETAALPNQNFVEGQESYEIMSGTRTVTMDLNEQLKADLDIDALVETVPQPKIPILSSWGVNPGQNFLAGVANSYANSFSPTPRNGFVGLSGGVAPADVERSLVLSTIW